MKKINWNRVEVLAARWGMMIFCIGFWVAVYLMVR